MQNFLPMGDEQATTAIPIARGIADLLRDEEIAQHVAPEIPGELEKMALRAETASSFGKDAYAKATSLAYDLIESVNNILKRIAEVAARVVNATSEFVGEYAELAGRSFRSAAEEQAPKDGKFLFTWLHRLAAVGITAGGLAISTAYLSTLYPSTFSWLSSILKWIELVRRTSL